MNKKKRRPPIFLLALIIYTPMIYFASLVSCEIIDDSELIQDATAPAIDKRFEIVIIDSCEYIWATEALYGNHSQGAAGGLVHKENCKFCTNREYQEL